MSLPAEAAPIAFVLTADRAKSRPFYAETLGLTILDEDDFAVTFSLGGETIFRLSTQPGHQPAPHTVLGWAVADIRAVAATLRSKEVEFKVYPGMGQDEDGIWRHGGAQIAWFTDPDGNVLSLTQFG